ncbi:HemK2/MTQ2 family protein methyltransferase [Streptomyces erythrochromogenes]|uniref:HemK2/MTQ2 family protein methyltransferase n=1 Tax=Streptomyces erythrochromogenes TaxID=285574 RepID=UPI00367E7063
MASAVMAAVAAPPPARLYVPPGVYRPQADTGLLARALAHEGIGPDTDVMDIGTGSGVLALLAASRGARVTAVDVSWRAVAAARLNGVRLGLPLHVLHGDFAAVTPGSRFDVVVANPPYVPSPMADPPEHGPERAWEGGDTGRRVIDRICARATALLRPGGVLLMVHSALCGSRTTVEHLRRAGLSAQVTMRAVVPWGPVLRSRRTWLEEQGLVGADEDREGLVVIRAERSCS